MQRQEQDIRLAVAGLGYWGKNILRNAYQTGLLYAACDTDIKTLEEKKPAFSGVRFTDDFNDIIKDELVNAVLISTPAAAHFNMAKAALLAGKDVFVEKPLALNTRDGEELVRIAEEKRRVLMVGHILQYHPAVIKLKELIGQGLLGDIQYVNSNRLNIGKVRVEENILWSFAPHDISVILMLLNDMPVKIGCFGEDYLSSKVHDVTLTTLEFKNKVKAHIFVSWLNPYKEQKLVVVGSKAMAVFDDMTREKLFIYPHKITRNNGGPPIAVKADCQIIEIEDKEPLKEEIAHFVHCVRQRKAPLTDGREGLRVLSVLEEADMLIRKETGSARGPLREKDYFCHQSSYVEEGAIIGRGTKIWHFSHILSGSDIGQNCVIGQNVSIGPDVKIGNGCKIQNNVSVYKGVCLEDDVFCGPSCVFTNVYTPRAFIDRKKEFLPTLVKKGASIGANATIISGITIGNYAFVAAGAVVKKDIPDYCMVAGVPARQIGWACECGTRIKPVGGKADCSYCGRRYVLRSGKILPAKPKPAPKRATRK
ncbi:MAG: Gfo/Idh/MocA family oxidoreductase [Candidatus Omnitrophica bacterium]|nr:Gfo/Idh/MocA family oxidoreductase [Candidatus Omnitrophota bacterium]